VVASGELPATRIPFGAGVPLAEVSIELATISAPAHCRLLVKIEQTPIANEWDFWVYPDEVNDAPPDDIAVFRTWNAEAEAILNNGGKVLLVLPRSSGNSAPVALGFTPIFWNTWCTKRQAPHTLGILCDPRHPALSAFPTDSHTDWHWWYVLHRASAMILDHLPRRLHPIIQVIDDWYTNRRLALMFEARVGLGRLLVSGVDFMDSADSGPVLRQLRSSVLAYMMGPRFNPGITLAVGDLNELALQPTPAQNPH